MRPHNRTMRVIVCYDDDSTLEIHGPSSPGLFRRATQMARRADVSLVSMSVHTPPRLRRGRPRREDRRPHKRIVQ